MDNQTFAILDSNNDLVIFTILLFILYLSLKDILKYLMDTREVKSFELSELYEIQNKHNLEIERQIEEIEDLKQQLNEKTK